MSYKFKIIPVIALMVGFGVPAPAIAKAPERSSSIPCAFHAHRVTKVAPYRAPLFVGRGSVLRGASLFEVELAVWADAD